MKTIRVEIRGDNGKRVVVEVASDDDIAAQVGALAAATWDVAYPEPPAKRVAEPFFNWNGPLQFDEASQRWPPAPCESAKMPATLLGSPIVAVEPTTQQGDATWNPSWHFGAPLWSLPVFTVNGERYAVDPAKLKPPLDLLLGETFTIHDASYTRFADEATRFRFTSLTDLPITVTITGVASGDESPNGGAT